MLAATNSGIAFFFASLVGVLFCWFFCYALCAALFYGIARLFCTAKKLKGQEAAYMMPAFLVGSIVGVLGGCNLMLKIAYEIGFRHGDLPMLWPD